ncbi:MAG: hypothetical protein ACR2KU_04715 [Gammaproteobacteria bacterium]|nr:hypothetical protein [Gammaproteobacteria bacterium]
MPDYEQVRGEIDRLLIATGRAVQDYKHYAPGAARGSALREVPLEDRRCNNCWMRGAGISIVAAKWKAHRTL